MANDPAFLGTGWSFPPAFTRGGADVAMTAGVDDIHQSLRILLSTRLGERVMREDFGCDLIDMQFEEISQRLINRITSQVRDAILYHESRIKLDGVTVDDSGASSGLLHIRVSYTVRSTNSRFNLVYPFYLHEASTTV